MIPTGFGYGYSQSGIPSYSQPKEGGDSPAKASFGAGPVPDPAVLVLDPAVLVLDPVVLVLHPVVINLSLFYETLNTIVFLPGNKKRRHTRGGGAFY